MTHLLIALLLTAEPDARAVELTPTAHQARVEALTCAKNLADCEARTTDRIDVKYLWLASGATAVVVAVIAFGAGYAAAKR